MDGEGSEEGGTKPESRFPPPPKMGCCMRRDHVHSPDETRERSFKKSKSNCGRRKPFISRSGQQFSPSSVSRPAMAYGGHISFSSLPSTYAGFPSACLLFECQMCIFGEWLRRGRGKGEEMERLPPLSSSVKKSTFFAAHSSFSLFSSSQVLMSLTPGT